ncbi:unnamed protein product [Arctogadus glacialis]
MWCVLGPVNVNVAMMDQPNCAMCQTVLFYDDETCLYCPSLYGPPPPPPPPPHQRAICVVETSAEGHVFKRSPSARLSLYVLVKLPLGGAWCCVCISTLDLLHGGSATLLCCSQQL